MLAAHVEFGRGWPNEKSCAILPVSRMYREIVKVAAILEKLL
jgi:hypothetical protein